MSSNLVSFNDNASIQPGFRAGIKQFASDLAGEGDFYGFNAADNHSFANAPNLELDASCPILIVPSQDGTTKVAIDADPDGLKDFQVRQMGDTVSLKQSGGSSGSINITSSNGSIHISGGSVTVNGVRMDASGSSKKSTKMPRVIIAAPNGGDVDADMSGQATLLSAVFHDEASLDLSGQCKVAIAAKDIDLETSGQGTVLLNVGGGDLKADTSGMGSCQAFGEFASVNADLSGMGSIQTEGIVRGKYKADASGMGSINHRGPIHGRIKKDASGMASINLG